MKKFGLLLFWFTWGMGAMTVGVRLHVATLVVFGAIAVLYVLWKLVPSDPDDLHTKP